MRQDLLVLTDDDLATISNRGTVKRATKELEKATVTVEIEELDDKGGLRFTWSDDVVCTFAADVVVKDAECTCPATGICRHLIRSVLAYKTWAKEHAPEEGAAEGEAEELISADQLEPWDPGQFTDDDIKEVFSAKRMRKAKKEFEDGLVLELVRSTKPLVRFHKLGHTLRFQVPGDLRYTRCDCAEDAPCIHVPMAIWGFRKLEEEKQSGFVSTTIHDEPRADELLEKVEDKIVDLLQHGFTGTPKAAMDRFQQLEHQLNEAEFIWPATIIQDLRQQYEHYANHDARFSPTYVADLIGEFLIRSDALRQEETPIPRLFIRGSVDDTKTKLGQTRLVGLGCTVIHRKKSVIIQAIMQDSATGMVMALGHEFLNPADETTLPEDFAALGAKLIIKGRDIASLGRGQLVLKKADLHADHHIELGRSPASAYPQNFDWNTLPAPVHVENFDEIRARLGALPPASLRPRRIGEDFHVVPVARVEEATFSVRDQAVTATLVDSLGRTAMLFHPYTNRNRAGTERLLARLTRDPEHIEFIAGNMHVGAHGLIIRPTALVFKEDDDSRSMLQPWVDAFEDRSANDTQLGNARPPLDPIDLFRANLANALGELYLLGLSHVDAGVHKQWNRLYQYGLKLGLHDILAPVADVVGLLDVKASVPEDMREFTAQAAPVLETSVVSRLIQELA
ncbi:MAG: hypothetical protein VYE40_14540 [Myxococcota bacterium]|jgi:hypothetical protein|nr:hypothetical protein [Myxococcota bacterium]